MHHTIIVRPRPDYEPRVVGITVHRVEVAPDVQIATESTEYLRALARACNERADRIEAVA